MRGEGREGLGSARVQTRGLGRFRDRSCEGWVRVLDVEYSRGKFRRLFTLHFAKQTHSAYLFSLSFNQEKLLVSLNVHLGASSVVAPLKRWLLSGGKMGWLR